MERKSAAAQAGLQARSQAAQVQCWVLLAHNFVMAGAYGLPPAGMQLVLADSEDPEC